MLSENDAAHLGRLRRETVEVLGRAIGPATSVAILDAPNQRNVGDSLIWAGELAYLERLGLRLRYVADIATYRAEDLRAAMPDGVVLLHGGGNLGDLWPGHQRHRERVVADLPDYRIVQLPQSVYFASEEAAALANAVLSQHPRFTMLLREQESIARAATDLPDVEAAFCCDMAFGFDPPRRPERRGDGVLVIGRRDLEGRSGLAGVPSDWLDAAGVHDAEREGHELVRTDWGPIGGLPGARWRLARGIAKTDARLVRLAREGRMPRLRPLHGFAERAIGDINAINIANALELYAGARLVIVDRLHAHVLAALLGIDHIVLDNSYRKIGSVFDEYSGGFSTARYATSLESARELASETVAA